MSTPYRELARAAENGPVVSDHGSPQVSPQEWDCGCVTVCIATHVLGVFSMRLAKVCTSESCQPVREAAVYAVDQRHGFTMEFAHTPDQHAYEYDLEEEAIRERFNG